MSDQPPEVSIDEPTLTAAGFTPMGVKRYVRALKAYGQELFLKAAAYGDIDKESGLTREITHDHVRSAAAEIAAKSRRKHSKMWIAGQAGEYVMTAAAGAGAGHLDHTYGILAFGVGTACAVLLFVLRQVNT